METIKDLQELIQDDIVCAMSAWSHGGDSIPAQYVNDCTSDLCNIVINRIEEFVNKEKKTKDT